MTRLWKSSLTTLDFQVEFVIHAVIHQRRIVPDVTQEAVPTITKAGYRLRTGKFKKRISNLKGAQEGKFIC